MTMCRDAVTTDAPRDCLLKLLSDIGELGKKRTR
jgi:hypothetical protein